MTLNKYRQNWKNHIQQMSEDRSPRQMMGNQLRQDNAADDPEKK
jgi:hypothetical protein